MTEKIDHPQHYGSADDPYEAIKVIEAWGLGFNLGNTVKYIRRAGSKGDAVTDLKKARWYLDREIARYDTMGLETTLADSDSPRRVPRHDPEWGKGI